MLTVGLCRTHTRYHTGSGPLACVGRGAGTGKGTGRGKNGGGRKGKLQHDISLQFKVVRAVSTVQQASYTFTLRRYCVCASYRAECSAVQYSAVQ